MAAIGVILLWAGYSAGLYGYSLIRGYCNTPAGLLNPLHPQPWSTILYTGSGVIPSGCGGGQQQGKPAGPGPLPPAAPPIVPPSQIAGVPKPGQGGRF